MAQEQQGVSRSLHTREKTQHQRNAPAKGSSGRTNGSGSDLLDMLAARCDGEGLARAAVRGKNGVSLRATVEIRSGVVVEPQRQF